MEGKRYVGLSTNMLRQVTVYSWIKIQSYFFQQKRTNIISFELKQTNKQWSFVKMEKMSSRRGSFNSFLIASKWISNGSKEW